MVKVLLMETVGCKKNCPSASFEQNEKCNSSKCFQLHKVCKVNLHRVTAHLMTKQEQQKVDKFGLLECLSRSYGISKAHVAVMNTDRVLRIWHNGLNMIYPPILSFVYENAFANIPETFLQIGDFVKVVLGAFKD